MCGFQTASAALKTCPCFMCNAKAGMAGQDRKYMSQAGLQPG
ncbi:hypothetical protein HMPREF9123_0400 [Neisseria bacilliformis ATCC BAA-1200]|uniref:Uncharacterized protein n=1 Tax=Neisseria bacilliformis ATCC BAA-1200 TaxID=888742 RepID=F2B9F4_9NEIS|nr:hypothetical protein HMPREF9123_0400 [Neisseria bacilliformis ATCC BAA-1200]